MGSSLFKVNFKGMACNCEIIVASNSQEEAHRYLGLCIEEVQKFEKKYSRYLPNSVTSEINAKAFANWVDCDHETLSLLNYANTLYEISGGLFDITSGSYRKCWDFSSPRIPERKELNSIRKLVDWRKVKLLNGKVRFETEGMEIDFGGFGKEYIVDKVANILIGNGFKNGFINFGGDLRVIGPKLNGDPWVMGIVDPNQPSQMVTSVPITQGALATSGNYEKYFDLDGTRYCHVLNPKSGMPVKFWKSVSVLGVSAVQAGTYTTIAMLQEEKGMDWLKNAGVGFFAIDFQDKIYRGD